jgi:hypothetical protein
MLIQCKELDRWSTPQATEPSAPADGIRVATSVEGAGHE